MSLRVRLLFSFPHYQILAVTIILSLVGVSEIVLSVLGYVQKIWGYEMGGGIWGGAAAFIAGVSGIFAANKKGVSIVRVFLIASILSFLLSIPVVVLSAGGLDFSSGFYSDIHGYVEINYSSTKLVHGFLLALAVVQFTTCLATTLVCLKHLYWNEWVIKRQHAKHLRQIKQENQANRHRASRTSTSSSQALLVSTNSGENSSGRHRKRKHRRRHRSRNHENSSHSKDAVVNQAPHCDIPDEQRHSQSCQRENRLNAPRSSHSSPHTVSSSNVPLISDASRIPEVGSNLMSVNSAEIPSNTVGGNGYGFSRPGAEIDSFQPPLPIEEDEELPPYEATLRPVDDESVFPMSLSENASHTSSNISSGDYEVQAWDSVSQVQIPSPTSPTYPYMTCVQETDVKFKYCPTASVQSDSSSLPIGSKVLVNSEKNKILGYQNDKTNNAITDPQGVSYHEFTRDHDQILGKEKQRTQSFLRERAMAREGAKSRKSSVQDNSDREDDTFISPLDHDEMQKLCIVPQAYQQPPKPQQRVIEPCTIHEILQQKGSDFLQNKYDSTDSTSSLSKDIQFIKEGPPIQYAPSAEQMLPEMALSPFSEISWHLLKDIPSRQSQSQMTVELGAKPKTQPGNGAVPPGIQNRVVKSELQTCRNLVNAASKGGSSSNVSKLINNGQRQIHQLPRFSYPPKSPNSSTISSDKCSLSLQVKPNSSEGKECGHSVFNMSQFSPNQTSTLKKDVDYLCGGKSKVASTSKLDLITSSPTMLKNKSESPNHNRKKFEGTDMDRVDISKENIDKLSSDSVSDTCDPPRISANRHLNRHDMLTDHVPVRNHQLGTSYNVKADASVISLLDTKLTHKVIPSQPDSIQQFNPTQQSNPTATLQQNPSQQSNPTTTQQNPSQQSNPTTTQENLSQQSYPTPAQQNSSQQSNPTPAQQNPSQQSNPTPAQQNPSQQSNPTCIQQSSSQQSNPTSTQHNPSQQSNPTSTRHNPSQQPNPTSTQHNPSQQSNPTSIQHNPSQQTNPTSTQRNPSQQSNPTSTQHNPSQQSNPSSTRHNPSQQPNPTSTQHNPSQQTNPTSTQRNPSQQSNNNSTQHNLSQQSNPTSTQHNPSQQSNPSSTQHNPSQQSNPTSTQHNPPQQSNPTSTQHNPSQQSNPSSTQHNPSQQSNSVQQTKPMYSLLL